MAPGGPLPTFACVLALLVTPTAVATGEPDVPPRVEDQLFFSYTYPKHPALQGTYVFAGGEVEPFVAFALPYRYCWRAGGDGEVHTASQECWREREAEGAAAEGENALLREVIVGVSVMGRSYCVVMISDGGQVHYPCCSFFEPRDVPCSVPETPGKRSLLP